MSCSESGQVGDFSALLDGRGRQLTNSTATLKLSTCWFSLRVKSKHVLISAVSLMIRPCAAENPLEREG